jgi:hypothetical protein
VLKINSTKLDRQEEGEGALDMGQQEAVEELVLLRARVPGEGAVVRSEERRGKETRTNNRLRKNNYRCLKSKTLNFQYYLIILK